MVRAKNRLERLRTVLGAAPVDPKTRAEAFATFKATGKLPEDQRIAAAVASRVRRGYGLFETGSPALDSAAAFRAAVAAPRRREDPILNRLLNEAVHRSGLQRWLARELLEIMASYGIDLTEPVFREGVELPKWGSAAFHLLGIPAALTLPPYEEHAHRVFAKFADLRERVPQRKRWCEEAARCTEAFRLTGELPGDDLLREMVLASAELVGLIRHAQGDDVDEVMAAFARVATTTDDDFDVAVVQLQRLAAAGHLAPRE